MDNQNITQTLNKDALPDLIRSLTDKNRARLRVRRITGDIQDHEATQYLIRAYEESDAEGIRCKILESIGKFHDGASFDWLVKRLDDPSVSIQCYAIWALGELKAPRAAAVLQLKLYNSNPFVRMTTIDALGKVGKNWGVASELETLLTDEDVQVRYLAAKALMGTAGPDATNSLAQHLQQEPSLEVQEALARTLGHVGGAIGAGRLIELLKNSSSPATEHWAESGLEAVDPDFLIPAIAPLLDGDDFRLKLEASRILRDLEIPADGERDTSWMQKVMRWAQSHDFVIREAAQGLIERIKTSP